MSDEPDLSEGDFVYQSDLELFLVVTGETENSYQFAAHGWREIGKERLDEYLSHDSAKLSSQEDVIEYIENKGDPETKQQFETLLKMFNAYADHDFEEGFPNKNFTLEDT
jgi:hypothetical protein